MSLKILVIDENILDYQTFINGIDNSVVHYKYNDVESANIMASITDTVTSYISDGGATLYIGLVWENTVSPVVPFFPTPAGLTAHGANEPVVAFTYTARHFLKSLGNLIGNKSAFTCDLLSCKLNKYNYKLYNNYIKGNVRYSFNDVGDTRDGGSWTLSSDSVSIKDLYFTSAIDQWDNVLDTGDMSILVKNNGIDGLTYDVRNKTYNLTKNITWNNFPDNYITLYDGEVFDGHHHVIDFGKTQVPNFPIIVNLDSRGLIAIDGSVTLNYPVIKNLKVISSVTSGGGGIIRSYNFNFKIEHCKHEGDIYNNGSGGIVGSYCYNFEVSHCKSKGNIINPAYSSGGIVGSNCGIYTVDSFPNNNSVVIKNCKYKGKINGSHSGGICGENVGYISGTFSPNSNLSFVNLVVIEKCKVIADAVTENNSYNGGICGVSPNSFSVMTTNSDYTITAINNLTITDCFYKGMVSINYFGGILGNNLQWYNTCGQTTGLNLVANCNISNCVTVFDKYGNGTGGIISFGSEQPPQDGFAINISKCISYGNILNDGCGGIASYGNNNLTIENCYAYGLLQGTNVNYASGIVGGDNENAIVTVKNCYFAGNIFNEDSPIYSVNTTGATAINCYANNPNGQCLDIILIKGHLVTLPSTHWTKVKHSYPILKLSKSFSEYKRYDQVPKFSYK